MAMIRTLNGRHLAAAVVVVALAGCAQCRPSDGGEAAPGGAGGRTGGPGDVPRGAPGGPAMLGSPTTSRHWLAEQSAAQLAAAHQRLAITPEQSPAWDRYAASVGALIADLDRGAPPGASKLPVMQRVGLRVDMARNRYAALENMAEAMNALYAKLNEEQRALADRTLAGTVPPLYDGMSFTPATGDGGAPRMEGETPSRGRSRSAPSSMH
jgi:hypothetical protein